MLSPFKRLSYSSLPLFPIFAMLTAACGSSSSDNGNPTSDTGTGTDSGVSDSTPTDSATDGGDTGPLACAAPGTDLVAKFDLPASGNPAVLDVPFPSDVYKDASGKLPTSFDKLERIVPGLTSTIAPQFAAAGSFGVYGGAMFAIEGDAAIDPASLPDETKCGQAGSGVFAIDLDATSAATASLPCQASYYNESAAGVPIEPVVMVRPAIGSPYPSKHRIAVILTKDVKGANGKPLQPSASLAQIVSPVAGPPTGSAKFYGDAIDKAASLGVDRCSIAAITSWTTYDVDGEIVDAHAAISAVAAPKLSWATSDVAPMGTGLFSATPTTGFAGTLDQMWGVVTKKAPTTFYNPPIDEPGNDQPQIAHDSIGAMGTAVFESPNLMVPNATDDAQADPTQRTPTYNNFFRDASGKVAINPNKPTNKVWVTIVLPKTAPPTNGYPVVIWQHGFGGDRIDMMAAANVWAREGWATVAINLVAHGPRALPSDDAKLRTDTSADDRGAQYGAYTGEDGFSDDEGGSNNFVGGFVQVVTFRDQLRQSALDLSSLVRVIQAGADLGPLATAVSGAKLDGTKIAYYGVSFGAITGTVFSAQEPSVQNVVLNVGGGGLATELVPNSASIMSPSGGQLSLRIAIQYGATDGTKLPSDSPLLHVLQHLVDPADPVNYARYLQKKPLTFNGTASTARNVLDIFARNDDYVPNEANETLVRALGIPIAKPHLSLLYTLPEVDASSGSYTQATGPFGVAVMESPAHHGSNVGDRQARDVFKVPLRTTDADLLSQFTTVAASFEVTQPTYSSHQMISSFIKAGFGGGAITVTGIPAPVDDYDGDGTPDATDPDPNDPTKK